MQFGPLLKASIAFFALVNPIQKILMISSLKKQFSSKELRYISIKSTITALLTLVLFLFVGEIILNTVFHVQLYAFRITCGVVLLYTGLNGLQKGVFVDISENVKVRDISAVPVAIPMIAGPATITAAATFPYQYGRINTIIAILLALGVNMIIMLEAERIGDFLIKFNILNVLIRIIGLIVATIGFQMVFDGITIYLQTL